MTELLGFIERHLCWSFLFILIVLAFGHDIVIGVIRAFRQPKK